jgi:NAD(P)-dependent dehydrogenase (short-subunit alcohol dehydrogenase family)
MAVMQIVMTGGNRGIGAEALRHLLAAPQAHILLGMRNEGGPAGATSLPLDLASFASVRSFADAVVAAKPAPTETPVENEAKAAPVAKAPPGGAAKGADAVYQDARDIRDGGGNGSIIGRNTFQRPRAEALAMLVAAFAEAEIILQGLEGLVDAAAFPFDAYEFEFDEEDPIGEVQDEGGLILSNAYAYQPEPARKLDS